MEESTDRNLTEENSVSKKSPGQKRQAKSSNENGLPKQKYAKLGSNPGSSSSNHSAKSNLFQTLLSMFPTTHTDYLQEQASELFDNPVALDRFISEHLARNCQPPDYWKPQNRQTETGRKFLERLFFATYIPLLVPTLLNFKVVIRSVSPLNAT